MPALKCKHKQLTRRELNESWYVTKMQWAVEAVYGIFKLLDNKLLLKIGAYFRIVQLLNNLFGKRLQSDSEFSDEILGRIRKRKDVENTEAIETEIGGWWRKILVFQSIQAVRTEKDLKTLFTGSYQHSQTISYLAEMFDEDGQVNGLYYPAIFFPFFLFS